MATNTKGLAQEIQIQILKKIQIRYERIYKEGMEFACYRIFSLFELSLPCVSFNAQDIDLTEQIYEIETPRWSDALGWGVVFPMGLFHPPPRVRIGQMMSPPPLSL